MIELVAAGASLLSGIFGRNSEKKAIKKQNEYNAPIQVRARAEAAGFNPLLFAGPGVGQQTTTGGSNYMGEAIANAGLVLADGVQKKKMMDIERSRLKMDQQKLDLLIQNATIRPKSGGVYAGNLSAPSSGGVGAGVSVKPNGFMQLPSGPRPVLSFSKEKTSEVPVKTSVNEYATTSGVNLAIPVGPDGDEVVTGAAIELAGRWKARVQDLHNNRGNAKIVSNINLTPWMNPSPKPKKYDLRSWPFYGFSATDPDYVVK